MPKKNKDRRYRLKPHVAKKLGLEVKPHNNKYTLTEEQERAYLNIPEGHQIKRMFFDIETAPMIVYSSKKFFDTAEFGAILMLFVTFISP